MASMLKQVPPWLWVIAGFLSFNLLTFDWYTTVWMDEVMFADPAANLYFGHGYTSSAWPTQHLGEFWAGNTPLYSFVIYGWFKVVGFGMFQLRALDYVLWSGAVGLLCLAVRRLQLIRNPALLGIVAVLLFVGDGVVFSYRSGRYESLIFLLAAACLWSFTIERRPLRLMAIILTASLFLPTAPILAVFAATFGSVVFPFLGRKYFLELCCVALGLIIGLGLLYGFHSGFGTWEAFRKATGFLTQLYYPPGQATPVWMQKLVRFPRTLFRDLASLILVVSLAGFVVFKRNRLNSTGLRLALLGIATFVVIPAVSQAVYSYEIYHYWQAYIPLVVCFAGVLDHSLDAFNVRVRRLAIAAVILMIFGTGLGVRMGLAMTDLKERDYRKVEAFVRTTIHPSDVVLADHQAFYPLHKQNVTAYYTWYFHVMTGQEAASINCLIINPAGLEIARAKMGGEWVATGETYLNGNKFNIAWLDRLLPGYFTSQTSLKYNLAVYRRR
ncbi:MAG: hypothetical protein V4819_18920 [Verrucomicrobiota bacterium]